MSGIRTIHIKRGSTLETIDFTTPSIGGVYYGSKQFSMNSILNSSELTSLFQEYRINAVVVRWMAGNDMTFYNQSQLANTPIVGYVIDYNDANTPSNLDALSEFSNFKECKLNKQMKFKLCPKPASEYFNSATSTGYAVPSRAPWLRSVNDSVPHYGLKYAMYGLVASQRVVIYVRTMYYISLRSMY